MHAWIECDQCGWWPRLPKTSHWVTNELDLNQLFLVQTLDMHCLAAWNDAWMYVCNWMTGWMGNNYSLQDDTEYYYQVVQPDSIECRTQQMQVVVLSNQPRSSPCTLACICIHEAVACTTYNSWQILARFSSQTHTARSKCSCEQPVQSAAVTVTLRSQPLFSRGR